MAAQSPALASRVVPNQGQDAGRLVIVPRSKTGLMHLRSRDCQQARGLSAGEGRLEGRSSRLGLASLGPLPQVSNGRTSPRPTRPSSGLWTFRPLYPVPTTTYCPRANAGDSVTEGDNVQTGLRLPLTLARR